MSIYRRLSLKDYVIYGLLIIGIISSFLANPFWFLVPLVMFGIIYLLYKYPPKRFQRPGQTRVLNTKFSSSQRSKQDPKKNRFKVIYGNRRDNPDDDPPPYH